MRHAANAGIATGLVLLPTLIALAAVPPELPTQRTSQVFSPIYFQTKENGESVFTTNSGLGPACLQYQETAPVIQAIPPTSAPAAANLDSFYLLLQQPAGILYVNSHATANPPSPLGYLTVETYMSQSEADDRMRYYVNRTPGADQAPKPGFGEIGTGVDGTFNGATVYSVNIYQTYINRILAQHSIVDVYACGSSNLIPGFIDSTHRVRDFIGIGGDCPLGSGVGLNLATSIFGNMSGISGGTGDYENVALSKAVDNGKSTFAGVIFQPDSFPNSAGNMRLYNAPRIIYSAVDQDPAGDGSFTNSLYFYQFGAAYPYNPNTTTAFQNTNYPGSPGTSGSATSGPLRINLRFSEPMDRKWSGFSVQLQFSNGTVDDVTSKGTWQSTLFANDNWIANISLPPSIASYEVGN